MRLTLTHARVLGALWAVALVAGLVGVGIRLATGEEQAASAATSPGVSGWRSTRTSAASRRAPSCSSPSASCWHRAAAGDRRPALVVSFAASSAGLVVVGLDLGHLGRAWEGDRARQPALADGVGDLLLRPTACCCSPRCASRSAAGSRAAPQAKVRRAGEDAAARPPWRRRRREPAGCARSRSSGAARRGADRGERRAVRRRRRAPLLAHRPLPLLFLTAALASAAAAPR